MFTSSQKDRPPGETFVWFTAMGLAVGLLMIVGLLGFIVWRGVAVFWPKPVAEIRLKEGAPTFRGSSNVVGVITKQQAIDARNLSPEQLSNPDPTVRMEKQLFVGNRNYFGVSYVYFNAGDIEAVDYPDGILNIERMEWGNALVYPIALEMKDGTRVEASDPAFPGRFRDLLSEVNKRRAAITRIEKGKIGKINHRMRELQLDERYLARQKTLTATQEQDLKRVRERIRELQTAYDPLAAQALALREQQSDHRLLFRLATGEERSQAMGEFVHHFWPNRMSVFKKIGQFLHHVKEFLIAYPREATTEGGIFPSIFGTVVMTLLMSLAVTPFGVLAAIYLREYAKQGPFVRAVRIAVNNLAGVPSIVFGIFGLGFFVYFMGGNIDRIFFPRNVELGVPTFGTGGVLWASLTLALMTVPVVIVSTEEALAAVSRGVRQGALACGASKWQTIQTLVLPASAPGILTGLILAMARGAGEVAPLILVGVVALAPSLPVDSIFPFIHLERKFMHLGFHIYDLGFQSPDSEAAMPMVFATTLVLILLVVVLNLGAILIRNHLKRKYMASAF